MKQLTIKNEDFCVNIFNTNLPGATICIVGGVHGNELCGLKAIRKFERRLLEESILLKGCLLTIVANYQAIQQKMRFIDFDLNRAFGKTEAFGHEKYLAQELTPFLSNTDYVIDLHSTSAPTKPFCAGDLTEKHLKLFSMTGIEIYTHGWEIHRGHSMLIDAVNRCGGVGIIAECGKNDETNTNQVAYHMVLSILESLEMIKLSIERSSKPSTIIKIEKIIKAKTDHFHFVRQFQNFDAIAENEIVAYDGEATIAYPYPYLIVMPTYNELKKDEEAFGIGII